MNQQLNLLSSDTFKPPSMIFLTDEIFVLGLPTRLEHALIKNYILTVSDLLEVTTRDLLKFKNFGPKSVKFIEEIKDKVRIRIDDSTEANTLEGNEKVIHKEIIPDNELIDSLFSKSGNERALEIIKKRYGILDEEKHTLEEIGGIYKLTRERIRQIIKNALKKMSITRGSCRVRILEKLENIFKTNNYIINDEIADAEIKRDFSTSIDGSSFLDLLSDMNWIQNHAVGDVTYYSEKSDRYDLGALMEIIVKYLKESEIALSPDDLNDRIKLAFPANSTKLEVILQCLKLDPRVEEKSQNFYGTYSKHGSIKLYRAIITDILQTSGIPLHFTEISNKVNDRLRYANKHIDVRRVHAVLIEDDMFAHTGARGTYGLTSWGIRKITTPDLIIECLGKVKFPLHVDQIYDYVRRYKDVPKVNVLSVLINNRNFEKVPGGFYKLSSNFSQS